MLRKVKRVVIFCLTLSSCFLQVSAEPVPPEPDQAIGRSLSIIRSATPETPQVLKILFYGQSISTPKWTDQAIATLRAKYPNVTFDYRNLALGGWDTALLEQAVARDVEEVYPDLIVFHAYGDHRAYERIIRTLRSETAADIIIQTDHVVNPLEPVCDSGFHLQWSPPEGCVGHFWFKQRNWEEFMSRVWEPTLAAKYDLALEPRRQRWNTYLQEHNLQIADLLADSPHPNAKGWTLMANLFTSWVEELGDHYQNSGWNASGQVRSFNAPVSGETTHYEFDGNRAELISAGPLDGKVNIKIDGKDPGEVDGCWQISRVTRLTNVPDWPALTNVGVRLSYREADVWTVRVRNLDISQENFDFDIESARTGKEGSGSSKDVFKSLSGNVTIQPRAWNLSYAKATSGRGLAEEQNFQWERRFVCADEPATALANGSVQQRHVLATGLPNIHHVMELTVPSDTPAILEMRTYRPPLID
ncbi:MAG: SGNH/GDSL hydrolase family protein [Pseudomonas sp.]